MDKPIKTANVFSPLGEATLMLVLPKEIVDAHCTKLKKELNTMSKRNEALGRKLDDDKFQENAPWRIRYKTLTEYADNLIAMVKTSQALTLTSQNEV